MPKTTLLAIETSCDETGVAVVQKKGDKIIVLADAVASQIDIHKLTGGVVPEAAAREHVAVIKPLIKQVIGESKTNPKQLNAIAVTVGPGLQPALSIGVTAAQTLAYAWHKPIIPVHHLEGHIYSALLQDEPRFPALALIVSGGHTMLIHITGHLQYKVVGSTRDDAVGEAFDKVARMLGLEYPGGPAISKLAEQGDPKAFNFTRPMLNSGDLDFSFSGLKTEVLYTLRDISAPATKKALAADIAAGFQQAAVEALVKKTEAAARQLKPALLLLAGGVAANQLLRQKISALAAAQGLPHSTAPPILCGDNAVMIGQAGLYAHQAGRTADWQDVDATARISIEEFSAERRRAP